MGSLKPRGSALVLAVALVCAVTISLVGAASAAAASGPHVGRLVKSGHSFKGDVRSLKPVAATGRDGLVEREPPHHVLRGTQESAPIGSGQFPGAQLPAPSPTSSFDGLHYTENCGGVQCGDGHPPDTNGDVGPRYYVETVNTAVGIYDKSTGTRVAGFSFNALMSQAAFGNLCDTDNFGDPVVVYDSFHDRWIITDFAFQLDSSGNVVNPPGSYQCFAVSKTGDPVNGGWNFYSLHITDALQDYPKFGVWPDGLYMSANMFGFPANGSFQNVRVWALNLAGMESGAASAQFVSFNAPKTAQGISIFTLLPSNARMQAGTPPAGRPDYFTGVWGSTNSVQVFAFHVDWNNTANSTFTGPTNSVAGSSWAVPPDPVPSKSGNNLDTLEIRLMAQNQYSNLGGVESLWNSHTVQGSSSSQAAVRWYQLPVTGGSVGNPLQASTFNPDSANRFMPSVAVDRAADMAIGYSVSSSTLFPAIRYAGRLASDPVNTLGQTETSMIEGTASQTGNCGGSACTRWGDYSAMTLDPDGCTFWYTNEYYVTSGLDDHTRIGSFALPGCTPIAMGTLQGTVTDAGTSNPVSGAVVTAGIYSTTTNATGVYSFPKIPAGTYTVGAAKTGYVSGSASGVAVSSGSTTTQNFSLTATVAGADHITITSSTANLASGAQRTLTAEIRDASDHLVTADNSTVVTFAQTSGSGSVTGLGTATASGGVASKTVTGATAGSLTITASASGLTSGTTTFSVTPGTATKLVVTSSTANLASGSSRTLTAEVRDANNNVVTSDNSTVVTFAKSSGSGTVTGLGTATASSGVASKSVTGATAGSITISAGATGLTSGTTTFSVVPGPATKLVVTSSTANLSSGSSRTLTAEVRDAGDNVVTSDNSTVVTFAKSSGSGTVTGLGTATASSGVASKSVTGATAGSITISAGATGLTSGSTTFTVTPGSATKLVVTSSTGNLTSGATRTLTAEIRDASDNLITSDNSTSVTFAKTAGSGSVSGLGSATASGGIASDTVTGATAGSVTITAGATGLTSGSTTFSVVAGTATQLVFTSSEGDLGSGAGRTLTAEIRDANGNLVTSDSSTIVSFAQTSGAGSVTGLGTATASSGIASKTVTGGLVGSVTVTASKQGGGLTTDTTTFNVVPGTATKLVFTSSTANLTSGATRTLTAELRDANDNVVTSDNSTVVTFAKTSGSGTVTGLGTATASSGVASKIATGATAGSVTITASATGLTSGTSTFTVTPGTATKLVVTSSTANLASGAQRTLTAEVRDANDNLITTDNSTSVTFAKTAGSGSISGLGSATASGGIASDTVTGVTAGPLTITASATGLTSGTSSFSVVAGAATKLVFTSSTANLASGTQRTLTAEIRDANDNVVSSDNTTVVTFAQSSGTGSVTGLGTATASAGVASKTVTGAVAGSLTISASSGSLTADTTSFTVTTGSAAKLVFTSSTSNLTSGAARTLTVEVRDAADNVVTSDNSTVVSFAQTGPGSVSGLASSATAVAGVASDSVTGATAGSVTITATATGLTQGSTSFTVVAGPATKLVFTSSTADLASGAQRTLTAEVRDAADNVVTSDNSTAVGFAQTGGSGSVTGLGNATASGGIASKTVTGGTAGSVTVTASASGLTSDATTFTVTSAPPPPQPTQLAITSSTANLASGSSREITVEIRDDTGTKVSSSSASVTLTQISGNGTLSGVPATVNASNGVATFSVTGIHAGPVTLQATSSGLTPASTSFSVVAGGGHHLAVTSGAGGALGSGSARDLTVDVRDANDNLVDSSTAPITFAQTGGAGSVTGLGAATAAGGQATAHLTGGGAGAVTVEASSPGLAPASLGLTVVPGSPARLAFTSPTADLASGATRDLAVAIQDAHGNLVPASSIAIAFAQSGGSGTLVGLPIATSSSSGVATTTVTGFLGGPVAITATSSGLAPGTTTFKIAPGPAARRVTLELSRRILAGKLRGDGPACRARVPVRVETRSTSRGRWKKLKQLQTQAAGTFKTRISRAAHYRAVAPAQPGCAAASSKPLRVTAAALKRG